MSSAKPRVSIGLPIYNAERFLPQALDAILSQTYTDFELIICDNASTDSTAAICQAYAAKDPRVRVHRSPRNQGVSRNFNRAFELAQGEYFKWCTHDDLPAPDYVEKAVRFLDEHPDYILCYAQTRGIDENGDEVRTYEYDPLTDSPFPNVRFSDFTTHENHCFQTFGVIRAETLRRTPLHEHYASSDWVLLARLALLGRFHRLPEYLHADRIYPGTSVRRYRSRRNITLAYYNPHWPENLILLPYWIILLGFIRAALAYPLPIHERWACLMHVARWAWRWRRRLISDVVEAVKQPLRPLYYRLRARGSA
jgi:glycosyltransferase involved in cell wall biosynthesis